MLRPRGSRSGPSEASKRQTSSISSTDQTRMAPNSRNTASKQRSEPASLPVWARAARPLSSVAPAFITTTVLPRSRAACRAATNRSGSTMPSA